MAFAAGTRGDALRLQVASVDQTFLTPVGAIPGVAVLAVAGRNGPGMARLRCDVDGHSLRWRAPGSASYGLPQTITTDGQYVLEDGDDLDKWARVAVYTAFLPPKGSESVVLLGDVYGNGVSSDDVDAGEALAGDIEVYTVSMKNIGAMALANVRVWVDQNTTGIEISSDGANWFTPVYESHVDVRSWSSIAAGASQTLSVRRTISASSSSDPDILTVLHFAWDGF